VTTSPLTVFTKEFENMTKTVEEGFRLFHGRLTPTRGESQAAKNHRASIETCLKNAFKITRFVRTGSFGNGTSIRGYSDVDYFACIPTAHLWLSSTTTLQQVCEVLIARFTKTNIVVRPPAVVLRFGMDSSESTEIVPAHLIETKRKGNLIYQIPAPDGSGHWIKSSPDTHNNYVDAIDKQFCGKVKQLVRLLKAWKYYCNVPIQSFYIEMRAAKYASQRKSLYYARDVKNILQLLWDNQLPVLQDPEGIAGAITPCTSDAQKLDALSKLKTALGRAQKARDAENAGKIGEAFHWWNLMFAKKFPAYS
jgi:hypothetical protein